MKVEPKSYRKKVLRAFIKDLESKRRSMRTKRDCFKLDRYRTELASLVES